MLAATLLFVCCQLPPPVSPIPFSDSKANRALVAYYDELARFNSRVSGVERDIAGEPSQKRRRKLEEGLDNYKRAASDVLLKILKRAAQLRAEELGSPSERA